MRSSATFAKTSHAPCPERADVVPGQGNVIVQPRSSSNDALRRHPHPSPFTYAPVGAGACRSAPAIASSSHPLAARIGSRLHAPDPLSHGIVLNFLSTRCPYPLIDMAEISRKRALDGDGIQQMRKKLRPSELPLSQSKRSAIDNLVHTFRKKGHYDSIRKELLAQYEASVCIWSATVMCAANCHIIVRQRRPLVRPQRPSRNRDRPQSLVTVQRPAHGDHAY
jgi:hypothetical protein